MLSEADARTIDACRQVLSDLATAARAEADYGGTRASAMPLSTAEVFARGQFAGYCTAADHALAAVLTHAATYLDDVHAAASLPGPASARAVSARHPWAPCPKCDSTNVRNYAGTVHYICEDCGCRFYIERGPLPLAREVKAK